MIPNTPPRKRLFLLRLIFWHFIFMPAFLSSQTQLFTEYQVGQFQWPAGAYARYQYLLDPDFSKEVRIISTLDVRSAQSNGLISFLVPGTQTMLAAEASLISDDPNTGFTWSGKILNAPGYIVLIHRQGQTAGFIQIGADYYEISPIDNNYQFLIKRKNDDPAMNHCPVGEGTQDPPPPEPGCDYDPGTNFCPAIITVLLILTPEAAEIVTNIYGSVNNFALLGQASVNTAFWNSDIPNKEIRVKWVVKSGFDFNIPYDIVEDLTTLRTVFAEPERTQHKADLVSFVPHIIYPVGGGVGNLPEVPDPNRAFSIVTIPAFMGIYGFAHEIGHNLGCHHNWPYDLGNDQDDVCAHAKRWLPYNPDLPFATQEIESWRTVVGKYVGTGEVIGLELDNDLYFLELLTDYPILHYSNPVVYYNGERTGRPEGELYDYPADNATQIREIGCAVNDYNTAEELSVSLSTPVCSSPTVFSAFITPPGSGLPGIPPYNVTWFWNDSGIFGTNPSPPVLGTGANITLSSFPACTFWVKCIVVSADNVQISRIQKVVVAPCTCYPHRPSGGRTEDGSDLATVLYPNPVYSGMVEIQFSELVSGPLQINIHDTHNRLLASQHYTVTEEGNIQVPLNDLPDGFYFLRVSDAGGILANHKLIIQSTN
jgi:hypothetical protein